LAQLDHSLPDYICVKWERKKKLETEAIDF